jgi:hypothetical protein
VLPSARSIRGLALNLDLNVTVDPTLALVPFNRQTTVLVTCCVLATVALSAVLETDLTCTTAATAPRHLQTR